MATTIRKRFGLALLGYDLVLSASREWKIIEVNALPAGLHHASGLRQFREHRESVFSTWARRLRRVGARQVVTLASRQADRENSDTRNGRERDLRLLARRLSVRGVSHFLQCAPLRSVRSDSFYTRRFTPRSKRELRAAAHCSPALQIQYACGNKHLLAEAYLEGQSVAASFIDAVSASSFAASTKCQLIVKPQYGTQSWGVKRINGQYTSDFVGQNILFQEWIESPIGCGSRDRQFDVRVLVLGDRTVGVFARVAPATRTELTQDSPLSWLTSMGTVVRVTECHSSENFSREAINLRNEDLSSLQGVVQTFQRWLFRKAISKGLRSSLESLHSGIVSQYWRKS